MRRTIPAAVERSAIAILAITTAAAWLPAAPARPRTTGRVERVRAKPPAAWDKATEAVFFDDAFTTLEGPRPDFAAAPAVGRAAAPGGPPAPAARAGGFRWSALVSPDTLADEIKDMKGRVAGAVASASDFKGGGYDEARVGFGVVALAFAVIAEHDGDVRWKRDAERARDLFARVGSNCKVGTPQSFAEAKARVDDLATLLDGSSIEASADRDDDFKWSQVAGRPALMSRLEAADGAVSEVTASKGEFTRQVERLLHEAEIVATIGEVIQRPDYEYHDDDTYRGHASAMRDAAIQARDAASKGDYDAARAAAAAVKKSCDACHGDYRG
ncbi:MAG: hypothetical protein EBR28_06770 [Planctomycetia bacterium]|nr:hypothetical protein [Planctomycetia bacterium]